MNTPTDITGPRRVLLVEDDPSLQRFVSMVLEDLAVELTVCGDVGSALLALQRNAFELLITDLMLPDRSGLDLLAELQALPALRGSARLVAFSAGLQPEVRSRLQTLDVERMLFKPCSVGELEACVLEILGPVPAASDAPAPPPPPPPQQPALQADQEAILRNFGGDAALYRGFRAASLEQFGQDLQEGERACTTRDTPALRRLAHSLKSVLLILGLDSSSDLANRLERQLEQSLNAGAAWPAEADGLWQELSLQLRAIRAETPEP
ncbi:hybrid sensor histidine kinase/response regulator [Paucibacter sp. DJ2R-2]|uniref:hybrid sensor histidine kinase/response regulator n=1 Tax=Paucibacter sp. DJ2R-2 TaxID=2893558 RepID=UPI0021E48D1B|nr:hybrid sensor histidine kinase/response regulator [Paucibacter sp. DJ2R-2]MCV2421024.1 response regulator [Paucibacter sp. DJ4R-1]MCV2439002.1 response regulator [Paucibacter sp. DJ2R-2]